MATHHRYNDCHLKLPYDTVDPDDVVVAAIADSLSVGGSTQQRSTVEAA